MRLSEGRSGAQEGANLIGIALVVSTLFLLDIMGPYKEGNSTYLSFPGAILLGLMLFLLLAGAMIVTKQRDLLALGDYAFGRIGGDILAAVVCIALFFSTYCIVSRFTAIVHALVFMKVTAFPVFLWIVPVVGYMTFRGLECIARMAKCFGIFLGVVLVAYLLLPSQSYETYRLYPLPFSQWETVVSAAFKGMFATAPAFLCMLCVPRGFHGVKNTRKAVMIGAAAAIVLVALAQLAIGMIYSYVELQSIFIPLYRLNLKLLEESYFYRLDKLVLFLWLIGAMITSAYYMYGGSQVFCRRWSRYDIRPSVIAACVLLLCGLGAEHADHYTAVKTVFELFEYYGAWAVTAPFGVTAVAALIKNAVIKRREANEASA